VAAGAGILDSRWMRLLQGHRPGLAYLAFTEAFERFSFYGTQGLLVLYMADLLGRPAAVHQVLGLAPYRQLLEGMFGRLSDSAFVSQTFGLYAGLVFLTPLPGGWIGDRLIGRRAAVMTGAVIMAGGHVMMAAEAFFLFALCLLTIGAGLLKGNIAAQVGTLYSGDDPRRTGAYNVFNMFVNIGAFVGPLICGALGEGIGWHYGFGAAGAGMIIGCTVYALGQRSMAPVASDHSRRSHGKPAWTSAEWRMVAAALLVILVQLPSAMIDGQQYNAFATWAESRLDRHLAGWTVPVGWLIAVNPLASVLLTPVVLRWWRWKRLTGREAPDTTKIAIGSAQFAFAYTLLIIAETVSARPGIAWAIAFMILAALSSLYIWPVTLSLVSRCAPDRALSSLMGIAYGSIAVANFGVGWVGQWFAAMDSRAFWLIQMLIGLFGVAAALGSRRVIRRLMSNSLPDR